MLLRGEVAQGAVRVHGGDVDGRVGAVGEAQCLRVVLQRLGHVPRAVAPVPRLFLTRCTAHEKLFGEG